MAMMFQETFHHFLQTSSASGEPQALLHVDVPAGPCQVFWLWWCKTCSCPTGMLRQAARSNATQLVTGAALSPRDGRLLANSKCQPPCPLATLADIPRSEA